MAKGDDLGFEILEFSTDSEGSPAHGDDGTVQSTVTRLLERAVDHFEENLEPDMVEATNYYYGRPFGDEEEGRSQVISTDVRDVTQAQLPQLIKVFTGPDRVVEFAGKGQEDRPLAKQMTDAVEYVLDDNSGFLTLHSAFKDALVRRLGWVKWWWEDEPRVTETQYTNLTQEGLAFLVNQFDGQPDAFVEVHDVQPDEETGQPVIHAVVRRVDRSGRARIAAVPPEEIVFTEGARNIDDATIFGHRRTAAKDELLAMGIDEDLIDSVLGDLERPIDSALDEARQSHYGGNRTPGGTTVSADEWDGDPSRMPVLFTEAYGMFDGDDDGIAELRKFLCVGPDYKIVNGEEDENGNKIGEIVDEVPFAFFTMDPEPHTIVGLSNFDFHRDIQRIKSQIERGSLNSLAETVEPKTEVVMGEVNLKDLTNPEVSGIVRVRKPGMMREIQHNFVGGDTLPMLSYYDEKRENRSGISKAAAGLDPDSLQSSTRAAVSATVSGAEQHIWLIAQIFAETGMKRLFRGVAKLIAENMTPGEMIRLRSGQSVPVDPRTWDLNMDIVANVALGIGAPEEKAARLTGILQKQEEYLQQGVPFVKFHHIRNTIDRTLSVLGYRNTEEFFDPWGPEEQAQFEQMQAQQEPEPDYQAMVVEVERMKVQLQQIEAENKRKLDEFKVQMEDAFKRDELAQETELKRREMELQHSADLAEREFRNKVEQNKQTQESS